MVLKFILEVEYISQWLSFNCYSIGNIICFFFPYRYGSTEIVIKEKAELDRESLLRYLKNTFYGFLSGKLLMIADFTWLYVLMSWDENKTDELSKRPNV